MLTRINDRMNMISGEYKEYMQAFIGQYMVSSIGLLFNRSRILFSTNILLFWKYKYRFYLMIFNKLIGLSNDDDYIGQILFSMKETINANSN